MLNDKAKANLRAGDILAAAGLHDPAASRYYYSLYQAAVHGLSRLGRTPGRTRSGAEEPRTDWSGPALSAGRHETRREAQDDSG